MKDIYSCATLKMAMRIFWSLSVLLIIRKIKVTMQTLMLLKKVAVLTAHVDQMLDLSFVEINCQVC